MASVEKTAAEAWEAAAIEKCRSDPRIAALGLCPVCMCRQPCLCEKKEAIKNMRLFYEKNRDPEPKLIGSWGVDMDGLMTELFNIATAPYRRTRQP